MAPKAAQIVAITWTTSSGRSAIRAASSRARICAFHQTALAAGRRLRHGRSRDPRRTRPRSPRRRCRGTDATCARSAGSARSGQRRAATASSSSCSNGHWSFTLGPFLCGGARAGQQRGQPAPRAKQQQLDAAGAQPERLGDFLVRRPLGVGEPQSAFAGLQGGPSPAAGPRHARWRPPVAPIRDLPRRRVQERRDASAAAAVVNQVGRDPEQGVAPVRFFIAAAGARNR